jgi:hypothetical protein
MISGVFEQTSNFFSDLFGPLGEATPTSSSPSSKDGFDRVAGYFDSTAGAWDLFRVVDQALEYVRKLPSLSNAASEFTSKVSGAATLSGISLSIPAIFSDINTLRKRVSSFVCSYDLPYSDGLRHQKILQAGKGAFLSGMYLTNSTSQAILFLDQAKIINLAQHLPVVDLIYQGSSLVSDSFELVEEAYKLNSYQHAIPHNQLESAQLEEEKWLSWMVVIKDVASIALAIISIVGISLAITTASIGITTAWMAIVAPLGLALSTVWLAMKISSYFYKQVIEDRYAPQVVMG